VATFGNSGHDPDNGQGDDNHGHDNHGGDHEDRVLSSKLTPNPLHPSTVLSFATHTDGQVKVVVYDMQGRIVKRLMDEFRAAGSQTLGWDGTNEWNLRVPSGLYFLRIQAPEASVTRRVAVVK
jgi:flagellar hook assembly protein FlgD